MSYMYSLVRISTQVTRSSRFTISLPTFLRREPVDAMTLRFACVMENMWHTTTHHCCMTFSVILQSPTHWLLILSLDMLKSLRRLPKLWKDMKVPWQANRCLMTLIPRPTQMHTVFKTNWRGKRFCGDPGCSPAVVLFRSVGAKRILRSCETETPPWLRMGESLVTEICSRGINKTVLEFDWCGSGDPGMRFQHFLYWTAVYSKSNCYVTKREIEI